VVLFEHARHGGLGRDRVLCEQGGTVLIRPNRYTVCGPVADLEASTELPRGALDYQREETEGFLLFCHTSIRTPPDELVVTVLGRRRPHPRLDWNGCTVGY
jgi:hypothetical protein